jgi:hypothetical protein
MSGHKPVEEHADRRQVLLDGGRRELVLQIVNESRDMERLDLRELVKVFGSAPVGKAAGRVNVGSSRMSVVDLRREKLRLIAGVEIQDAAVTMAAPSTVRIYTSVTAETPAKPPATMFPRMQRLKYAMDLTPGLNSRSACANLRP